MRYAEDDGFTLVEVLVALALLGMLTIVAYGAVQFGQISWRNVDKQRRLMNEQSMLRTVVGRAVATAYPAFGARSYSDRRIAFDGRSNALQLVAPLPDALNPGVMGLQRFFIHEENGQVSLLMSWRLDLPSAEGGTLPEQIVEVAGHVRALQFGYFGQKADGQAPGWFDDWENSDHLPLLVRFRVWRADVSREPWIDLTTRTHSTRNVECIDDPSQPVCRRLE